MKMTSRIYGIAVKETVDYYDFDEIRIQFNRDTKHWSILSNYDNIWYNGTNYTKGQLILMFSDYTVAEYRIMAQHTEVIPYVNYMYVVTTNAEINPASIQNGKVEYVFEADPENEPYQFTCKMLINNDVQKTHKVTDVDIKNYKNKTNGQLPTLFYNLKMDWHGMNPESPYLPYSFTIISNSNYIKDGTAPRQVGEIVLQIPAGVGQPSYYHKILDETNKHEAKKNADSLPVVNLAKYKGAALVNPTGKKTTFTRETIIQKVYHDHTKVYYNGHYHRAMYCVVDSTGSDIGCWKKNFKGLAFTYADPFWFCMTTSSGFEYGGRVLESKKLVKCWKGTDPINMTLSKTTSRKKPAPDDAPYDDIIYDVVSNDVNVTVTKIRRKTHIDASGHKTTEDIQEGLPIVFDTSSSPVLCWNIEFRASNNVWTIYSKCGYIRYNGRQYPKNRSILDFNAGEEMHIEIKDETEKYEVDEVVTYTISNVTATAFIYKLWTVGTSYTLKVEKSVPGEDPEPWVTVNFYDAIYDPVIIDDIQISFDNSKRIWKLISRSDDLYYYDKKLSYGDLIAEWGLNTVFSLRDNNALKVILPNPNMDVRVKSQSNKVDFKGVDISDFIPRDLNEASYLDILVVHSVTKGVWTVTSKNDNTYVSGTRYTYNKEIFSCPDKQGMPEIDIMCQHKKDESGQPITPYENWHYFISISYDSYEQMGTMVINCKKMATAPQTGWVTIFSQTYYSREKEDPEYQNRTTMILTKENSKSMYGYIWKRDMPGPGPTTIRGILISVEDYSSYSAYKDCIIVFDLKNKVSRTVISSSRLSLPIYISPFNVSLRSFYYEIDGNQNISYINYSNDGFKNDRHSIYVKNNFSLRKIFFDSMMTIITHGYSNGNVIYKKYLLGSDSLTLMDSYTFEQRYYEGSDYSYVISGKFTNGNYISVGHHDGAGVMASVYIYNFGSSIRNFYPFDYEDETRFPELWDYLNSDYPHYKGSTGTSTDPHVDGYSWGIIPSMGGYLFQSTPACEAPFKTADGDFVAYVRFAVYSYITWYQDDRGRWRQNSIPVGREYLVSIKFNKSNGTPSFEMTSNNVLLDCFNYNTYSSSHIGKNLYNWNSLYECDGDTYLLVPEYDQESNPRPAHIHICKYDKETTFFSIIKTINRNDNITIDAYDSGGYKIGTVEVNLISDVLPFQYGAGMAGTFESYIEYLSDDSPLNTRSGVFKKTTYRISSGYYSYFYFDNPLFNVTTNCLAMVW